MADAHPAAGDEIALTDDLVIPGDNAESCESYPMQRST